MVCLNQSLVRGESCKRVMSLYFNLLLFLLTYTGVREGIQKQVQKINFLLSSATEQDLFHGRKTQPLGPHLYFNVLLSLFNRGLHQINDSPEAVL